MGLFDDIRCRYPLLVLGANDIAYQTKDTPSQYCEQYEIREDGTLWEQKFDILPSKLPTDFLPATWCETMEVFRKAIARVNHRWEQVADFTGEIRFYSIVKTVDGRVVNADSGEGWLEWSAYFTKGKLRHLELITSPLDTAQSEATL